VRRRTRQEFPVLSGTHLTRTKKDKRSYVGSKRSWRWTILQQWEVQWTWSTWTGWYLQLRWVWLSACMLGFLIILTLLMIVIMFLWLSCSSKGSKTNSRTCKEDRVVYQKM
jgi:hypothetical protein